VIDGERMSVVPSRADLIGLPEVPMGTSVEPVEDEGWRFTYTPRVRYDYDAALGAIVVQRNGGPGQVVVHVPASKLLEGGPNTFSPSPDGRHLAYVDSRRARRSGVRVRNELFLADLQTGDRRRIAALIEAEFVPWSRDGRHVYFANGDDGPPYRVRVVDVGRVFDRR
jgi:Tol biopolymer transport system component